jgi:hypothetical protein
MLGLRTQTTSRYENNVAKCKSKKTEPGASTTLCLEREPWPTSVAHAPGPISIPGKGA